MKPETYEFSKALLKARRKAKVVRELSLWCLFGLAVVLLYFCWFLPGSDSPLRVAGRIAGLLLIYMWFRLWLREQR